VYGSNRNRTPTFYMDGDLYMIPTEGGEERMLTPDSIGRREQDPAWSPDGKKIAFVTDRTGYDNVAIIDVASGEIKPITDTPFDHANPTWSPDGSTLAYVVNEAYNYYIETISPAGGKPTRITAQKGVSGGMERIQVRGTLKWLPDNQRIVYTYMSPANTSDLWIISTASKTPRRITDSRDPSLKNEDLFVWPELFKYKSFDGMEVQGFVYKPKGVTDGDRAPLAVFYRANSTGQHPVGWQPYVQFMVSKGYVVFAPNFRGSTGNGKAYADAGRTWGGDRDIKDAMMGVDLLAQRDLIDPNRMVMWGGSTGGFFVSATLIQRPKAFKAGVVFYGGSGANLTTRAGYFQNEEYGWMGQMIGGTPLTNPKSYYDRSLIHHVADIDTPIMFLYAQGDPSARFEQVREIVPILDHFKKEYSYKLYEQEPHGWYHWRPVTVEDSLKRVGDFFDQKALGTPTRAN
jgi:dipeptidyl aminopeptidase/acylaminoacyl peptidase